VRAAQRLRYQVYCVEKQFEDAAAHSSKLEIDEFDSHAVHGLLVHRTTGIELGTVRLVLPRPTARAQLNQNIVSRVCEMRRGRADLVRPRKCRDSVFLRSRRRVSGH
jgi:N-acyl amino acid synthase of PEP-CTERM/exosortase system